MFIDLSGDSLETVMILLKVLIFSVLGFYILSILGYKNSPFLSVISPLYGLFSLISIFVNTNNMLILFILGVFGGYTAMTFFGSINEALKLDINCVWFGLLNIFNYYILNDVIDKFLECSSLNSVIFLFIFGISFALIDLAFTFRNFV